MNLGGVDEYLSGRFFLLDSGFPGLQDSVCLLIEPILLTLCPGSPIPSPGPAGANSFSKVLDLFRFTKYKKAEEP
jgi:hypothetical protein